jgi:hypothetical protein
LPHIILLPVASLSMLPTVAIQEFLLRAVFSAASRGRRVPPGHQQLQSDARVAVVGQRLGFFLGFFLRHGAARYYAGPLEDGPPRVARRLPPNAARYGLGLLVSSDIVDIFR